MRQTIQFGSLVLVALAIALHDEQAACADDSPVSLSSLQASFAGQVAPVFRKHCTKCHAGAEATGELRLVRLAEVLAGGDSGEVIQPGSARQSLLYEMIQPGSDPHMPPKGQLGQDQINQIRHWIDSLPTGLSENDVATGQGHWAFQRPLRPPVPQVKNRAGARTPIDAFVLSRLEAAGLAPCVPATRLKLIRRATFDLIGLPPTRQQVTRFLEDKSPLAVSRLIDRLLASPHYGERWGRHWLDLARYADSNGFETDRERLHAWHYRDYVIDSFNADKPYDRFVIEQLAGDEVAADSFETVTATGFCRNGPTIGNTVLEKNRYDELDDVISTTSEVFLGLTLGCARCHDHKYDPISQRDYYSMLAIFHSIDKQQRLIGTPEQHEERKRIEEEIKARIEEIKSVSKLPSAGKWRAEDGQLVQEALAPNVRLLFGDPEWTDYTVEIEFLKTDGTQESYNYDAGICLMLRATDLKNFYWAHLGMSDNREHAMEIEQDSERVPIFPKVAGTIQSGRWYRLRASVRGKSIRVWLDETLLFQIEDVRHTQGGIGLGNWMTSTRWRNLTVRDADGTILLDRLPDPVAAIQPGESTGKETRDSLNARIAVLRAELSRMPIAMCITDPKPQPRETKLLIRGDHRQPGPVVEPAVPAVLTASPVAFPPQPESAKTTGRRLNFARWLVSPDNPLTSRVMVNRIWQYHFGRGLVESPSNFGLNGAPPSHPDLLDWLAVEFTENSWSIKHIHRLIVTSSVYRQGSVADVELGNLTAIDPDNRLLWRFPRRRLDAEVLRDRILAASGTLNLRMHGPGIRPRIHPSVIATSTTRKWPTVDRENPQHWRRSVYIFVRRSVMMPFLEVFDAPTTTESCERRLNTTVPTQALQMMNDVFTNAHSSKMARRILAKVGSDDDRQVEEVYWNGLARPPRGGEQADCIQFLQQQRAYHRQRLMESQADIDRVQQGSERFALADLCHVIINLNEFVYTD